MGKLPTNLRTLRSWFVYDPACKCAVAICETKKIAVQAKKAHAKHYPDAVLVKMTGHYIRAPKKVRKSQ